MIYTAAPANAPKTEQEAIAKFFDCTDSGFFLDIGAFDGLCYSNTRALWERGWSGVLVEPDPVSFSKLKSNYANAPRVTLINSAVVPTRGPTAFYRHKDPQRIGWHSTNLDWVDTWPAGTTVFTTVNGITFSDLPLPPKIDLLSIDAEGSDYDILWSIPDGVRPRLIILEVDKAGIREKVEPEMERRGYSFIWGTYLNSLYADSR